MPNTTLVWFQNDLRIHDNPALHAAVQRDDAVLPVFIEDFSGRSFRAPGAASRWWLHHALTDLDASLSLHGLSLIIRRGDPLDIIPALAAECDVHAVTWNRRHEPGAQEREEALSRRLESKQVAVERFQASLLWEPGSILNQEGNPFRVFTPFWNQARRVPVGEPLPGPTKTLTAPDRQPSSLSVAELNLLPERPWDREFLDHWAPDLQGAEATLEQFVSTTIESYAKTRDKPGVKGTSRLSPYLQWGQLGPRQVWQAVHVAGAAEGRDGFKFLSELAWREFAWHLMAHYPETVSEPLNQRYADFPWQPDERLLDAWQTGRTGFPIVDAGMRQLWRSGWMHNRVRMVAASVLVKHFLQPWQDGARWFWDTLLDADLANNTLGWQWVAGCGADAAPYFRVFNPVLQGEKFDPDGAYVRRWVPELAGLPDDCIHQPWNASKQVLAKAGVELDVDYPRPVVEHRTGRERALAALARHREKSTNG